MNLSSPYPFKQPPDADNVAVLVAWHRARDGEESTLCRRVRDVRLDLAALRGTLKLEGRPVRLMRIAEKSEILRECEAALREVLRAAQDSALLIDRDYSTARCPRCHRDAPAFSAWGRMGRLILFHDDGPMFCSGVGEQVPR